MPVIFRNALSPALEQQRLAVLATFSDPMPAACALLADLTQTQWSELLTWLDMSGLALYLLDNLKARGLGHWLPPDILSALERRAGDSRARTGEIIADFITVEQAFHEAGLSYALLKGFSLWPVSVPKVESRSQLDLDYLITAGHAPHARALLEAAGYQLRAISGRSWEFKSSETPCLSLADMYKPGRQRSIELHLEEPGTPFSLLPDHVVRRLLHGVDTPVLAPADLFLGQGLHLYKHIVGESWRVAHLLEFYRHILVRYHDITFWQQVRELAQQQQRAPAALGLALLVLQQIMGDCAPEALTSWTVTHVPPGAQAWVQLYGRRAALGTHPGSKLYLLLAREMTSAGVAPRRSSWRALIPRRLPPAVFAPQPNESLSRRLVRNLRETRFRLSRLRFHAVEGTRYCIERILWQRRLRRLTMAPARPQRSAYSLAQSRPAPSQRPTR